MKFWTAIAGAWLSAGALLASAGTTPPERIYSEEELSRLLIEISLERASTGPTGDLWAYAQRRDLQLQILLAEPLPTLSLCTRRLSSCVLERRELARQLEPERDVYLLARPYLYARADLLITPLSRNGWESNPIFFAAWRLHECSSSVSPFASTWNSPLV